jgi:hypothetical protein
MTACRNGAVSWRSVEQCSGAKLDENESKLEQEILSAHCMVDFRQDLAGKTTEMEKCER